MRQLFLLEDITVAFREQLVRHVVGQEFYPNPHGDGTYWPDPDHRYWSQSSRCGRLNDIYDNGFFELPASIKANAEAKSDYLNAMEGIQATFRELVDNHGIPQDDASMLLPQGMTHRVSWTPFASSPKTGSTAPKPSRP